MGAFERLQNYSSRRGLNESSDVFDVTTSEGAFLERVHHEGYKMYHEKYRLLGTHQLNESDLNSLTSDEAREDYKKSLVIDKATYDGLSADEQAQYEHFIEYTELYNALVTNEDMLINAIAGSGKTSMLIFKIMHDIVTGEAVTLRGIPNGNQVRVVNKMWVCTFLRTGAEELESALVSRQRALGYTQTANQISFSTLDAEFKRCLNAMGVATNIGDSSKLNSLLRKAINSCNITRDGNSLNNEDYQIIGSIITYARGRLDNKRYIHPSCADYSITPTILELIINQFASLRRAEGIMDFDEMQELLYKYLYTSPNKAVQDFVASRYNFIYVDEFQDTSQMQYAILKFYARGRLWMNKGATNDTDILYTGEETLGKIIAVGDVSQTIYSFKGSDANIIAQEFDRDFRPSIATLSVNWRCPSKVLNPVVASIHENKTSRNQDIFPSREGGEFFAYKFSSYKNMLGQLRQDIKEDIELGNSVAILCRTNFDGMIPALSLEASKIFDFSISGENMTLSSPLPRKLIGVSSLFTERSTPMVKNTLTMLAPYGAGYQIKQLIDTLKMNNMSVWQVKDEDLNYSAPNLYDIIKRIKGIFIKDGVRDKKLEVEALRVIYWHLMVNNFKGNSAYCESARAYIETLLYIIDANDFQSVYDFIEEIEFLNDKLKARIKKKAPIKIATVHEFKGKECDSVYIWNDSEGTFPSSKCNVEDEEQLEEERRVHYIACTRARKREHIYAIDGKVGMFAREMDAEFVNPIEPKVSL